MAKKGKGKTPKAPPGPGYVSEVQAPAKRTGKGPSVPKVKFRKPMAPPTKVERDKRMKKTLRALKEMEEHRGPACSENGILGQWTVEDDDGEY